MLNRRSLLTFSGAAIGTLAVPQLLGDEKSHANSRHAHSPGSRAARSNGPEVAPFSMPMPVPSELRPASSTKDTDVYRLPIEPADVDILPGYTTSALTFGGTFVGPTIRASRGRRAVVTFPNRIDVATNVHLHGGDVPAHSDGHPMDLIEPGRERDYQYPNTQRGATLWYHAHPHHVEAEHIYRGMHGFYLIDDPAESDLGLPSGRFDIPIMLRDAEFDDDGQLVLWGNPANRTTILTNGKPQPYFEVAARKYRIRLLNGANERTFRLDLEGKPMTQIASDGGLLPSPACRSTITFSPGERVEIVLDFSEYPIGTQLVLADESTGPVLRFDVTRGARNSRPLPRRLRPSAPQPRATVERDVVLKFDLSGEAPKGLVNGKEFDPNRVDFVINRGVTEIWTITNADTEHGFPHNFHMHLVQFRVLDRDGRPPTADDAGWKDTVAVPPGSSVRVKATFDSVHTGRYLFHCHLAEHASVGMMAQMEIVE